MEDCTVGPKGLEALAIQVEVMWPDGTHPEWSNLLFHNNNYPGQAVIGDVAPGVVNGQGQFTLPVGFEYDARAAVNCDAGTKTEHENLLQHIRSMSQIPITLIA